jgi:DNA invertase Pin-like site-specific DNA recombinase
MALIGYARVSKSDGSQDLETQIQKLKAAGVEDGQIYIEQASGAKDDRPVFRECLKACRKSDVLVFYRFDRITRSLAKLVITMDDLSKRGVMMKSLTEPFDTSDPTSRAMVQMIGIFAELERNIISRRTKDSLAYRKSIGVKLGRPSALTADKVEQLEFMVSRGKSVKEMCEKLSISKPTYYKWIKSREVMVETPSN